MKQAYESPGTIGKLYVILDISNRNKDIPNKIFTGSFSEVMRERKNLAEWYDPETLCIERVENA